MMQRRSPQLGMSIHTACFRDRAVLSDNLFLFLCCGFVFVIVVVVFLFFLLFFSSHFPLLVFLSFLYLNY